MASHGQNRDRRTGLVGELGAQVERHFIVWQSVHHDQYAHCDSTLQTSSNKMGTKKMTAMNKARFRFLAVTQLTELRIARSYTG